jgi:Zn-dependent membrane protease YugP
MIWNIDYFLFMLPAMLIGLWAQIKLSSAYGRFSRVGLDSGMTGAEAAQEILDRAGLANVSVQEIRGHLTDHYDPSKQVLCLSSGNYRGRSVAAVGVAAHEAGHALQHQAQYAPLNLRMALVPVTQFASYAWIGIILLGMLLGGALGAKMIWVAIAVFSVTMVFQLVTLPVEFDASNRARKQLLSLGIVRDGESDGVGKVLNAAAWTYVAALVSSVMQLLYFLSLARNRD